MDFSPVKTELLDMIRKLTNCISWMKMISVCALICFDGRTGNGFRIESSSSKIKNGISYGCSSANYTQLLKKIIEKEFGKACEIGRILVPWYARLPAYYAKATGDKAYAARAWDEFFNAKARYYHTDFNMQKFNGIQSLQPVYEVQMGFYQQHCTVVSECY